jgi:peptide/nickel transport system permease protein
MKRLVNFLSHWQNLLGFLIVLLFALVALAAPLLSPPNDNTQGAFKKVGRNTDLTPHPPSEESILGTLPGQTDVFHALVWGTRDAMVFGLSVAMGAFLFGSLFGAASAYAGGAINHFMMRVADAFLTFPVLAAVVFLQEIVATTIQSMGGIFWLNNDFYGRQIYFEFTPPAISFLLNVDPILISLILFSWMPFARLVNTMVITLKNTEYVQAARALGGGPGWIVRRHLLPNSMGPAIVLATRDVGSSVILQATITFIGLGGTSAWGIMLSVGRDWIIGANGNLFTFWWAYLPATLMIMMFGIGWNLLGDGINDALDPTSVTRASRPWKRSRKKAPAIEVTPIPTTPFAPKRIGPDPVLIHARTAVNRREMDSALHAYRHLIQRRRELACVIGDLALLAKEFPLEVQYWQTLGDALAQDGDAEDAARANAYAKQLTH